MSTLRTIVKNTHVKFKYVCPKCYALRSCHMARGKVEFVFNPDDTDPNIVVEATQDPIMWGNVVTVYHRCEDNMGCQVPMIPVPGEFALAVSLFGKAGYKMRELKTDNIGYPSIKFDINMNDPAANHFCDILESCIKERKADLKDASRDPKFKWYYDSDDNYLVLKADVSYDTLAAFRVELAFNGLSNAVLVKCGKAVDNNDE